MSINQVIEKLEQLKLTGMIKALEEQLNMVDINNLAFEERLNLLADREIITRENSRIKKRLSKAKLKINAQIEEIDFRKHRDLDKSFILSLASCEWIRRHQNIIITGATGMGKTFLANALAHKACMEGFSSQYFRFPRLLSELNISRADGSYFNLLKALGKLDVLIIDDWGLSVLTETERRDVLEIFEDRFSISSTIITSQMPIEHWHEVIGDNTIADAILDRIVHNAHKINMRGDEHSMRKELHGI